MQRIPAVSRPSWLTALSGGGDNRRSPIEIVATAASYVTRSPAAGVSGLRTSAFGKWTDGVTAMREDCIAFAGQWRQHNERAIAADGPLWVVLGDSTAQGLGAPDPMSGYVGQVLRALRASTGLTWRVLNLSVSGALIRDVQRAQLPLLPAGRALVTCGIGANDILYTPPAKLFADLRALIDAVPDDTVLLDLPVPAGFWGVLGRVSVPYVMRINRTIRDAAAARDLTVAPVSECFVPPWAGKFACDHFHPSQDGYRDWARALLTVVPGGYPERAAAAPAIPASCPGHDGQDDIDSRRPGVRDRVTRNVRVRRLIRRYVPSSAIM
jgi:acyl-CoA thioesterase I